jgi:hypothetical protein
VPFAEITQLVTLIVGFNSLTRIDALDQRSRASPSTEPVSVSIRTVVGAGRPARSLVPFGPRGPHPWLATLWSTCALVDEAFRVRHQCLALASPKVGRAFSYQRCQIGERNRTERKGGPILPSSFLHKKRPATTVKFSNMQ